MSEGINVNDVCGEGYKGGRVRSTKPDSDKWDAPPSEDEIALANEWIKVNADIFKMGGECNERMSSYGLKHLAERFQGYISNGAFIVAALRLGFRAVPTAPDSPNVYFDMWPTW